jgi:thiol-disulfide isomerase/thioredoxin
MSSRGRGDHAACGLANVAVIFCSAIVVCAIIGCSQPEPSTLNPDQSEPAAQIERPPAPVASIPLVDRAEFDALLAQHKGQVVLVDCWATWCLPCVAQLPHSAELAKVRGGEGLKVIAISFDDPESADQVLKVLEDAGASAAGVACLQCKTGTSTESFDAFEIASGALPHYKLYDRQGKLRRTFELDPSAQQQFTPADIDAAVTDLLAE